MFLHILPFTVGSSGEHVLDTWQLNVHLDGPSFFASGYKAGNVSLQVPLGTRSCLCPPTTKVARIKEYCCGDAKIEVREGLLCEMMHQNRFCPG